MTTRSRPDYPFAPKSSSYLEAGQFWAIPLTDGRFGCGRVLDVPREPDPNILVGRRAFLAGLMDWVGTAEPNAAGDQKFGSDTGPVPELDIRDVDTGVARIGQKGGAIDYFKISGVFQCLREKIRVRLRRFGFTRIVAEGFEHRNGNRYLLQERIADIDVIILRGTAQPRPRQEQKPPDDNF